MTGPMRIILACLCSLVVSLSCLCDRSLLQAADWPQWRGADGQGVATAKNLPLTWSESENVAWKTPLPGKGWSSPVVVGNRIWLTAAIETPDTPENAQKRLKANTGNQPLNLAAQVEFIAVGLDRDSGKIVQQISLFIQKEPQWVHELNSYASPSPVIDRGLLYCHFGTFGTACVDLVTNKILWTNRDIPLMHENGPGSSPMIAGDLLVFHCDGSDKQFVVALDRLTGKVVWQTDRSGKMNENPQLKKAYGTPLLMTIKGEPQVISPGADWLYSYDPKTGKELWKLPYGILGFSIVPRPVTGHGMIYFSTSYMQSELLAVRVDGSDGQPEPHIVWRSKKGIPKIPSPLLVESELYLVSDEGGVVTCLDALTGEAVYRERIDGKFCSSPIFADGKLFFCDREGVTTVVQPGREFKVLAKNHLDSGMMASPVAVDTALFLRTEKALYRIEAGKKATAATNAK